MVEHTPLALPPALRPWQLWLGWFDAGIAAMLGDWLPRLHPMLGPSTRALQGRQEPDGMDNLQRRGPYERLLTSEWALADLEPDEFLRRAASHEHLFLAPRLVSRKADARLAAVFDAGPHQWGAPRLLHVALWIALARRAREEKARFTWGLAQQPGELHAGATPHDLRQLLSARTAVPAGDAHWQAWAVHLRALPQGGEHWLIGPPEAMRQAPRPAFSHAATVQRSLDLNLLHARLGPGAALRALALPIPTSRAGARLLRGDFLRPSDAPARLRFDGRLSLLWPPVFSLSGQHVGVVLSGTGQGMVFSVADHGDRPVQARSRACSWGSGALVAPIVTKRSFAGLCLNGGGMRLWNLGRLGMASRPEGMAITPGLNRWRACAHFHGRDGQQFLLLDDHGHLLRWQTAQSGAPESECLAQHVVALAQVNERQALFMQHVPDTGCIDICRTGPDLPQASKLHTAQAGKRPAAAWLCGRLWHSQWNGAACLGFPDHGLLLQSAASGELREALFPLERHQLAGLVVDMDAASAWLPLAMHEGKRRLLVWQGGWQTLYEAGSDMRAVACSADGQRVAVTHMNGELVVLADGGRRLLLRVKVGADG